MPAPGSKEAAIASEGVQTLITVGLFNSTQAEVLSGLGEGQYVKDLAASSGTSNFMFGNRNSSTAWTSS